MLVRLTKEAIATLEFRAIVTVLALIGAVVLYFSVHHGHRPPPDESSPAPTVPAGDQPPPSRL